MKDEITVRRRDRRPKTKWSVRFAWFWTVVFTWLAIGLIVEVAQKLEWINAVVISMCIVFTLFHYIRYEHEGQYWKEWEDIDPLDRESYE